MEFTLNGNVVTLDTDPGRELLSVLRSDLGLAGTKYGYGIGLCGACTVLVDNVARRSRASRLERGHPCLNGACRIARGPATGDSRPGTETSS